MSAIVLTKVADPYKNSYVYRYAAKTTDGSNWIVDLDEQNDGDAIRKISESCDGLSFEMLGLHASGSVYIGSLLDERIEL